MTDHLDSFQPPDALDDLVTQLLECGGVLSSIISHMVEFEASGRSAPDAAPIPEVAHSLIRGVLDNVGKRHSKRDIKVASRIVKEATAAICDDIFYVGQSSSDQAPLAAVSPGHWRRVAAPPDPRSQHIHRWAPQGERITSSCARGFESP